MNRVFVCLGCGLLEVSERSDAVTCSPACRVRAHRNGALKRARAEARAARVPLGLIQQTYALVALCPHLIPGIEAGRIEIDDTREEVWKAYWARLEQVI